jgi:polar amino acid transport system substrate-binding protein
MKRVLPALTLCCLAFAAEARTLAEIKQRGAIGLCAHPNSLPFASKTAEPPGFQIELGRALAHELGVSLTPDWILTAYQISRADCDIMLDVIADPEAQEETRLKLSEPYYRSGVSLAVPQNSRIGSFATLDGTTKVGVQVGSLAAMTLDQRHVRISIFGFEEDMLDAIGTHEVDAAAVTATSAGYYNKRHPGHEVVILPPDEAAPALSWNVAVGMRRPDDALKTAIDEALVRLTKDGTIAAIYSRYGVTLEPPKL